jgi:SM-20-related protein
MLNITLNPSELSRRFAERQRIVVPDLLQPTAADAIWECMTREVPWELVFKRGKEVITLDETALARIDGPQMARLTADINSQAQNEFQFVYWKFSMVDAYRRKLLPNLLLHQVLETLASAEMITLVRTITGFNDIQRVDAQATLYRPGNFLTAHSDEETGSNRRAAYVVQLCRHWKAEWGGLLHFLRNDGGVSETFVPGYNQMALFAVPQEHTVSMVAPFAGAPRLAITGWFTS